LAQKWREHKSPAKQPNKSSSLLAADMALSPNRQYQSVELEINTHGLQSSTRAHSAKAAHNQNNEIGKASIQSVQQALSAFYE